MNITRQTEITNPVIPNETVLKDYLDFSIDLKMQIIRESFSTESHEQIEETKGRNNNLLALCNDERFKQIKQQILPHPRTMGK